MIKKPEGWNQEPDEKLSFDFLIECAKNEKKGEWNALYLESEWKRVYSERTWDPKDIRELIRQDQFIRPNFRGKDFQESNLRDVDFSDAHLEGAKFIDANLKEVDFQEAHLEGADLSWAIVNENTSFRNIKIDDATGYLLSRIVNCKNKTDKWYSILVKLPKILCKKKGTDFSNVALGTCRIDTLTKTRIEKNIRDYRWNDWYKNHRFLRIIMRPF